MQGGILAWAFTQMTSDLTALNASDRQIMQVVVWRSGVSDAQDTEAAYYAFTGGQPAWRHLAGGNSRTHRGWKFSMWEIISELGTQQETSEWLAQTHLDEAAAAEAAAAAYDAQAAGHAADGETGAAADCQALAAAARAEAARHRTAAMYAAYWHEATVAAAAEGMRILADTDRIQLPVSNAVAAAGGPGELTGDKTYYRR